MSATTDLIVSIRLPQQLNEKVKLLTDDSDHMSGRSNKARGKLSLARESNKLNKSTKQAKFTLYLKVVSSSE